MRNGLVLFTSDRGITPAAAARRPRRSAASTRSTCPSTPTSRSGATAAHPGHRRRDAARRPLHCAPSTRGSRWRPRAAVDRRGSGSSTAVALPVESDPITLAKTIATLDHLSGGRVTIGAGFGWNTDELADHHVPADRRRTVLKEYVEAMRALWTQEEASYDGEFVSFGPSWAYPKPVQAHVPLIIGAGGGPKTFAWIARHADGWMTTPTRPTSAARSRRSRPRGPKPAATASPTSGC